MMNRGLTTSPDEMGIFDVDSEDIDDDDPEIVAGMERLTELRAILTHIREVH